MGRMKRLEVDQIIPKEDIRLQGSLQSSLGGHRAVSPRLPSQNVIGGTVERSRMCKNLQTDDIFGDENRSCGSVMKGNEIHIYM